MENAAKKKMEKAIVYVGFHGDLAGYEYSDDYYKALKKAIGAERLKQSIQGRGMLSMAFPLRTKVALSGILQRQVSSVVLMALLIIGLIAGILPFLYPLLLHLNA